MREGLHKPGGSPTRSIRLAADGELGQTTVVAEEVPISLRFHGIAHVVLMASPGDLNDLAVGFALTDGICRPEEIVAIATSRDPTAIVIDTALCPAATARFLNRRRNRSGASHSSCGVCGVTELADLPAAQPVAPSPIDRDAIRRALRSLPGQQPLNRLTGAVHAAAWARPDGTLAVVREDIGRHNALDKLIGARAAREPDGAGFCVVTSRCSSEMVQKAGAAGMSLLVCISAPTSLAITEAGRIGLGLVALARADSQTLYVGEDRLMRPDTDKAGSR